MVKVYQTKVGENGDCFNACLASILEMDIKNLPQIKHDNGRWLKDYQKWLRQFNLGINWFYPVGSNKTFPGYAIGVFERKDKKYTHAVVCYNSKKLHDPFPSPKRKNLKIAELGKLVHWYVITILDPSKLPIE